ncbi:MAG: HAD family phosphatase [Clostridia bacterium]|nr:HAD family phosphatase [Clostridia bacterium]
MPDIKLIALDLDGTLLNRDKVITNDTLHALEKAADQGIRIVPATGRLSGALPSQVDALPFVRYVIGVNGAEVRDRAENELLYSAKIEPARATEIMTFLDGLPVIYDCYMDGKAWISQNMKLMIPDYAPDEHYLRMWQTLRQPVPDLKDWVTENGHGVQKVQCLFRDMDERKRWLDRLPDIFSDVTVTSSVVNNIEFTHRDADKGKALTALAAALNIPVGQTMAFGDDLNDVPMLKAAGIGVSMANAKEEIRSQADYVTLSCNEDGIARALEHFGVI